MWHRFMKKENEFRALTREKYDTEVGKEWLDFNESLFIAARSEINPINFDLKEAEMTDFHILSFFDDDNSEELTVIRTYEKNY